MGTKWITLIDVNRPISGCEIYLEMSLHCSLGHRLLWLILQLRVRRGNWIFRARFRTLIRLQLLIWFADHCEVFSLPDQSFKYIWSWSKSTLMRLERVAESDSLSQSYQIVSSGKVVFLGERSQGHFWKEVQKRSWPTQPNWVSHCSHTFLVCYSQLEDLRLVEKGQVLKW